MHSKFFLFIAALVLMSGCADPIPPPEPAATDTDAATAPPAGPTTPPVRVVPPHVDPNVAAFPPGYAGDDFAALKRDFDAKVNQLAKTTYETTKKFEKRASNTTVVLTPIRVDREYALKLTTLNYDAAAGVFRQSYAGYRTSYSLDDDAPKWVACELAQSCISITKEVRMPTISRGIAVRSFASMK